MPDVELARREGIELVRTGTWGALTGSWTPTRADILAAVEAQQCPAIRRPRLKLGHTDQRFNGGGDGEPALGWIENLRAADDGDTLVGDQVALPWLNSVQAAAYPDRSVEGNYRHKCSLGHTHPFVLTAVALLGVTPPAVSTLKSVQDLPAMLGVAASSEVPEGAEHVQVTIVAADGDAEPVHTGAMVALIPTAEDAERLAVEGGEPSEELHVTLAYLGEAAALGAKGRQDVIDGVSRAANGLPQIEADAFSVNVFNPPGAQRDDGKDRDTCLVLGLSGDPIDAIHDLVGEALMESLWDRLLELPAQHRPWHCHMTLLYSDDLSRVAELASRVGPVRFDRIRVAFGGEVIDIPLIPDEEREEVKVAATAAENIRTRVDLLRAARVARVAASAPHPFDEHKHRRDGDGQFSHTTGGAHSGGEAKPVPKSRDKLKLDGRAKLDDDETLVSSGKVAGGELTTTDTALAVVDSPNGRTLRVGIVEHDELRDWDGTGSSTATLDEDGIGTLWDDVVGLDEEIGQRRKDREAEEKAHQDRVASLLDAANDYYVGLPEDEQHTAEAAGKYKQMKLEAYRVEREEGPAAEFYGDVHTIPAADGGAVAYRLQGEFDDTQRWQVDVAVRPPGAGDNWSFEDAVGDGLHTTWEPKQLREMARSLDRLTVTDDEPASVAASLWSRHEREVDRFVAASARSTSGAGDAVLAAFRSQIQRSFPAAPVLPAAEPEHEINPDPKEDPVSTELSGIRSRLGLDDTADEQAILSALDELKTKADTPAVAEPTPEMVAASAAATVKAEKATEAADLMKEELTRLSGELATIKASAASSVKASFFGSLLTAGKLKPADRETWEQRYDRDPEMVTDILSVRAEGSEVPVMASGTTGPAEPKVDDDFEALIASIDMPTGKAV